MDHVSECGAGAGDEPAPKFVELSQLQRNDFVNVTLNVRGSIEMAKRVSQWMSGMCVLVFSRHAGFPISFALGPDGALRAAYCTGIVG